MSQTTACLLSSSNELKMENDVLQKSLTIFVWHNFSKEHFKMLIGNMGTKDNFMKEQGNKEPPYDPQSLLRFKMKCL